MKFSATVLALAFSAAAAENMSIRGNTQAAAKLMKESRQLYNNNNRYYDNNAGQNGAYQQQQYNGQQQQYNGQQQQYNGQQQGQYNGQYNGQQGQYNGQYNGQQQQYNGQQQQNQDMGENGFLANYSLKLLSCLEGEQSRDYENGEVDMNTVVFRLCPTTTDDGSAGCSDDKTKGCKNGYGDFAVGLSTFVEAYFEAQRDNYNFQTTFYDNYGEEFNVEEYTECKEYELNEYAQQQAQYYQYQNGNNNYQYQGNGNGNGNGEVQYFIGPSCSADGTNVALKMYMDQYCQYESDVAFADLNNGFQLPYADGGFVSSACMPCMAMNENYEYELSEMCQRTYESVSYACEENMEYYGYYGQKTSGCDYVSNLVKKSSHSSASSAAAAYENTGGNAKKWVFGIFLLCFVGAIAYVMYTRKKAQRQAAALNQSLTEN